MRYAQRNGSHKHKIVAINCLLKTASGIGTLVSLGMETKKRTSNARHRTLFCPPSIPRVRVVEQKMKPYPRKP